ncbi:MAG: hypothetical protein AAB420_01070 [Patescibacteria group bacterium]
MEEFESKHTLEQLRSRDAEKLAAEKAPLVRAIREKIKILRELNKEISAKSYMLGATTGDLQKRAGGQYNSKLLERKKVLGEINDIIGAFTLQFPDATDLDDIPWEDLD